MSAPEGARGGPSAREPEPRSTPDARAGRGSGTPIRVLVVDDEPQMLRALRITLGARDYQVRTAVDGRSALSDAASHPPDIVILDLGLPDIEGIEVIEGLRGWTQVPIIVLSGRTGGADKVAALDAGADDYVTKPFGVDELLARLRAVSRRTAPAGDTAVIELGPSTVDLAARRATRLEDSTAKDVRLTPTEWHILEILLRNPGKLVSQRQLLVDVWGPAYTDEFHYLRQYLARLRHKLEPDPARPRYLLTEPGMGYRYQP